MLHYACRAVTPGATAIAPGTNSTNAASVKFLCDLRDLCAMLFLPVRPMTQVRGSKQPTHTTEKTPSWTKLRCENADSSSVSQLVALIKNIGYVEPEL
jgi:hypothetical protein